MDAGSSPTKIDTGLPSKFSSKCLNVSFLNWHGLTSSLGHILISFKVQWTWCCMLGFAESHDPNDAKTFDGTTTDNCILLHI